MTLKLKKKKYRPKSPIFFKDVGIEKVLVSNKISSGEKDYRNFIGYLYNDHKVKRLHIMLPKATAYVKRSDGRTKWMYFLFEDHDLLEKYNIIWDKVSANIKKELDREPVYNKKSLKTKIKSDGDDLTDFYDKEIPKVDLAVISLDSALNKDGNYYPQVFLKEFKYIKVKVVRHFTQDIVMF